MDRPIPFFYYDILSRIIPGAMTLATLYMVRDILPTAWLSSFQGNQSWKAIVVPLVLGGLCYMIGVVYETIDYSPIFKWLILSSDDRAFTSAWYELNGKDDKFFVGKQAGEVRRFRFQMWDALVFKGGSDPGMGSVFAHCHRFQAEYKMLLHLTYPSLLFAVLSFHHGSNPQGFFGLGMVPALFYLSHLRNRRRWLQTLVFSRQIE
jgi:hypothetical protein